MSRQVSACLRPTTQKGEETLLVRPRTTHLALSENLDRPETRGVVEGDHLEYHGEDQHEQKLNT